MVAAAMASCALGSSCVGPGVRRRPLRIITNIPVGDFGSRETNPPWLRSTLRSASRDEKACVHRFDHNGKAKVAQFGAEIGSAYNSYVCVLPRLELWDSTIRSRK